MGHKIGHSLRQIRQASRLTERKRWLPRQSTRAPGAVSLPTREGNPLGVVLMWTHIGVLWNHARMSYRCASKLHTRRGYRANRGGEKGRLLLLFKERAELALEEGLKQGYEWSFGFKEEVIPVSIRSNPVSNPILI